MIKKFLRSPLATIALFVVGAALLLYGGIGGVMAAPSIQSEYFGGEAQLTEIQTALLEGDVVVEGDDALMGENFFAQNDGLNKADDFKLGETYNESLKVKNIGTDASDYEGGEVIPEYVRVTVYCYWADEDGTKRTDLDPGFINLEFDTSSGWAIDQEASNYDPDAAEGTSGERTVLYYDSILNPGDVSSAFTKSISIDKEAANKKSGDTCIYDGVSYKVKVVVDAVQTHNEDEARIGAWGQVSANG